MKLQWHFYSSEALQFMQGVKPAVHHSLTRPPTCSPTHSLTRPLIHSLAHPPTRSLTHSFTHILARPPTHSLACPLDHPLSLAHPLIHSIPTLSLARPLNHPTHPLNHPTHSLTCNPSNARYTFRYVSCSVCPKAVPNHVETDWCCSFFVY